MNHETIAKHMKISELLIDNIGIPELRFFDIASETMLDEKIKVLTALREGKSIEDIPNFYDVLELMPGKNKHWD